MDLDLKQTNKIIGNSFKKIRKARKFTQEEVAEKSDVTPEYLSKFENGKYNASIYNIILLCKSVDTNPMQLLHFFFEDSQDKVMENLISELQDLNSEDQKLILDLIKRMKQTNKTRE